VVSPLGVKIMEINDNRINQLIKKFGRHLVAHGLEMTIEFFHYPGGIVWITEKQFKAAKGYDDTCLAYVRKVRPLKHGLPSAWQIVLIKERVLKLTDEEFIHLLAHECSHVLMGAKEHPDQETACDVLAEHFFGFKKPEGSTIGYLHDDIAFEKIYGESPGEYFKVNTAKIYDEVDKPVSLITQLSAIQIDKKSLSLADERVLYNCAKHLSDGAIIALNLSAKFLDLAGVDSAMFREIISDIQNALEKIWQ
jgi:hypothetical protein